MALVVMGGIAVVAGYLVGSRQAEPGTALLVGTFAVVVIVFGAGLLPQRTLGDPLLESIGAVLELYGAPGVVGLLAGTAAGYYVGDIQRKGR